MAITNSIINLLKPLVRILLKNNVPYSTFCDIARWVYVDEASHDFTIAGKKQTISRIATITGLSRKETARLKGLTIQDEPESTGNNHRAVRVINGWRKDPGFLDAEGHSKPLLIEGQEDSFAALVRKYSGDIPYRAILDEMLRAGVVKHTGEKIKLISEGYIVSKDEVEKMNMLGIDTGELISTIVHNINESPDRAFFQRKASYDNIPEYAMKELRIILTDMSSGYMKAIDEVISRYDKDTNPEMKGKGNKKAGVGIYYFE